MITLDGKVHIKRYLAQFVPSIAQSIAFGVGPTAEVNTSTKLQFEAGREDITLTSYDFVNNKLIFKAPLPDDFVGKVYEVGLYSLPANAAAGEFGSKILTTFDSATEEWVDNADGVTLSAFNATNARIGADALRQTPATSATRTDALKDIAIDLSGYSSADKFVLAYNVGNGNTSAVRALFLTDASNYYTVNFGTPTSGYKVTEITKGAATPTGTPNWANITEIRVQVVSTAGGASQVDFDGLRIDDEDTLNSDYVLVSRELLSSPYTSVDGVKEIEFAIDVNV